MPSLKIKKKSHWKVSHQRQDTCNSGSQWGHPYCKKLFSQSQEMGPLRWGLLRWLEVGEHIWALELYYVRVSGCWDEPGTSAVRFLSLHWGLLSAASHSTVSFHNSFLWFDLFLDPGILWTQFFVQDCFPRLLWWNVVFLNGWWWSGWWGCRGRPLIFSCFLLSLHGHVSKGTVFW